MLGIIIMAAFMVLGAVQSHALFYDKSAVKKTWIGFVMGLVEMMWLPALFAFVLDFTLAAQNAALILAIAMTAGICFYMKKTEGVNRAMAKKGKEIPVWLLLLLVLPMAAISGYLQYTHNFRPVDGAYHVGQSTYGDLCMHAGFASGMIGQSYPPEYTILPGTLLGYPFLVDQLSATMMIYNTPIHLALSVPGSVMTALIYWGFAIFAWEITKSRGATAIAFILFALNGGLGFIRILQEPSELQNALYGYYQTPTNMPDENLRWVNALSDLIIPQRALMAGWMCLMVALYFLSEGMKTKKTSSFVFLGLFAGCMPMIHTHTFLGLGVISLGCMIACLVSDKKSRGLVFKNFALYGSIACVIAFPQLFKWAFPQTVKGGTMRILFNWVNNAGSGQLIDGYFWFWIKNVGLVYLFFPLSAVFIKKRSVRALSLGAFMLYVMSEFIIFQPNVYDNIKLFFIAFIALLPQAAELFVKLLRKIRFRPAAALLLIVFMACSAASGAITIAREVISDYEIFSESQIKAGEFIKKNTPEDSVILTSNNHNNSACVLAGRNIVCGSDLYVYFHGLDYERQQAEALLMLSKPYKYLELFERYGIDYVYVSSYERSPHRINWEYIEDTGDWQDTYAADEYAIQSLFPLVYEAGPWYDQIRIYAVSERAQAKIQQTK